MTEDEAKSQLILAQDGDHEAQSRVALYVYEKYLPRARRLAARAIDPVMSVEDIEESFFEAVMRAVMIADGRGCDFYHIGQRGIWAVQSEMRSMRRTSRLDARVWARIQSDDGRDPAYDAPDPDDAFDRLEEVMDARQRVEVLTTAPLRGRLREAVEVIASGLAGDPREKGFNAKLAMQMKVSPQRASQIMGELREQLA
jgi:hypothetical protein